ncbi:hypothetical protein [Paenibacillus xerothermodurans]|uniref:Family 2 glycosyl transferase n=1 Tax=Paenibacillus xerothermodurans TaxID=1977292 RepID=A0A2W1N8Y3_PAEXE|nr:hypothetical protein [Paenibacillus xerothermodurans]PZE19601.1 hypothetical protein CBW46_017965 [Paenibacillus xerothermodurans]
MDKKTKIRIGLGALGLIVICAALWIFVVPNFGTDASKSQAATVITQPIQVDQDIKRIAAVQDGHLAVYDGTQWKQQFWSGVNLGATTPGHAPGELSPAKEDYLRWFKQMKDMNVSVVRVYTILPPFFYEALAEFNSGQQKPLYIMQGIWSPEEQLQAGESAQDAMSEDAVEAFQTEIKDAVNAIHGDLKRGEKPGRASGKYTTDVSAYLLGWVVGTEWDPHVVKVTNDAHPGMQPHKGTYFESKEGAAPFENWLAQMLDTLAQEEMKYGWQHPVSFTNWVTTDPLTHPNEPSENEDMVSVDPMNVAPTDKWTAGYFASYHVYPYYPDFLKYEEKYQIYKDAKGQINPYAGYLNDLRAHHKGIPVIVAEYGVPSSRGMAHYGPLNRNQGMHAEAEQGKINTELHESIYDEKYDGAILFAWHDEWFKITWNTMDLELPADRRPMWRNMLTNEEHFGVVSMEPGKSPDDQIMLDGKTDDWDRQKDTVTQMYPGYSLTTSHDEAYVHLLLKKQDGSNWNVGQDNISIGFDTLDGGSQTADKTPGVTYSAGQEFVLSLKGDKDSDIYVNSAYDHFTWLNGHRKKFIPWQPELGQDGNGKFLPWMLAVSRELKLPATKQTIPFDSLEAGKLMRGITDPAHPEFNNLADWYADGSVIEIRLPWMLLGFTDPSQAHVWSYPYGKQAVETEEADGIRIEPHLQASSTSGAASAPASAAVEPLNYEWDHWDEVDYHERLKQSYHVIKEAFGNTRPPKS